MGGLEIVGIVLGAIPITIAAIEIYRERQSRIKFKKKAPFILSLIQSLKFQHWILLSHVQMTLNNAGVEYDRSTSQLSPNVFQDPEIAEAVDEYLAQDAGVYYEAVDRCHKVLAELVGSIEGFEPLPKGLADLVKTYSIKEGQYQLPKRIRFPLKRDALDRQIREMEQATNTLRQITDNISSLKTQVTLQPSSRQIAILASALNTVRKHVTSLYSAIAAAYLNQCHSHHEARLILRSRSDIIEKQGTGRARRELSFTVLFSPAISLSRALPSYRSDIKVVEGGDAVYTRERFGSQRRVSINQHTSAAQAPLRSTINDICRSIQTARETGHVLDLYLSENKYLTYCHVHGSGSSNSTHFMVESDGFVSLEQLLADKSGTPWLRNHRMALSLIIASSLLQLISTPWLRFPLTCSYVRFSRGAVHAATLDLSAVPEPFVEEQFCKPTGSETADRDCNVRQYMLELGILLLEIEHWRTINDYADELTSKGQSVPTTRHDLARNWVDSSKYHILPFHLDAITRCVECTFATSYSTLSWDDVVLRKSVAEYVLKPLQENCPQQLR